MVLGINFGVTMDLQKWIYDNIICIASMDYRRSLGLDDTTLKILNHDMDFRQLMMENIPVFYYQLVPVTHVT